MTYDGTIRFDTRIDTSDLDSQMSGLESKLSRSTAKLRDVMQGPVAAFKEMARVAGQIKGEFDKLEAAWASQERASAILKATLEATGASAWTSAKEIEGMAESLQDMTAYGDDAVLTMQNVLLGFKNIKGDNFKEATTAILDMATVMGMDLTSAAQAVGKALDDPVQGMDSLSRQGFKFTEQQKDMLKALVESGKIEEAQGIILKELSTTYGGAAEAAAGTASAIKDKLNNALGDLQEEAGRTISEALKPMRENLIKVIDGFTDWFKVMNENGDMPELLNKITTGLLAVTAAMAEFVLVSKGAAIVNTMTLAIQGLSKALAANWVALAAAGAVAAITLIIGKIKEHKLEQEEAARAAEEQARKTDELKNSIVDLATEYQNLYDKTNPTADEQQRMLDIANQLHTLYPTLTNDVIEYAAKNSNLATSIKEVALAQERVNLASLLGKKEAINQNIIEVQLAMFNAKTAIERTTYENMQAALEEQLKKVQGEIKIVEGRIAILNNTTKPTTDESAGGTVPSKEAPKVEKSQGERLQELDAKYKAQIEAEKELGHDTTEIERQYYKERYDLLMDFIAEDAKAGLSFENSFKSRLKGLNTTLGDELAETDRILSDFDAADTAKAKGDAYTKYVESNYTEIENIEDNYEKESLARLEARNKKRISLLAQLHGKEADYIASEAELQEWLAGRYEWASEEELLDLQSKLSEKKRADAEAIEEAEQYNDYISSLDSEQQGKEDKYEQESLKRLEERNKKRLSLLAQLYGHSADYIATEAERQEWLAGRYEWASDEEIAALQEQLNERKRVNAEAIADQQQYSNAIDKADSELPKNEDEYEQEALNRLKARNKERLSLLAQLHGKSADYIASEGEKQEWLAGRYEWASDEEIAALRAQLEEQKKAEAVQKAREAAYNTYIENRYKDTEEIEDEYEQESLNRLKERNKKRLSLLAQLHGKEADYVATEAERQEWLAGRYEWASDEEIEALQKQLDEKIKVDDEIKKRDTEYINLLKIVNGHTEDYQATQEELVEWLGPNFTHATDEQIRAVKNYLRALGLMRDEAERVDAANGADAQSAGHVATATEIMTDKVKKATEALKEQADAINNSNQSADAQIRQLVEFARAAGVCEDAIDALVAAWNSLKQAELQANADKGSAESQALTLTWTEKLTNEIKDKTLELKDQIKVQDLVNQGYDENIAQMILAAQSAGVEKDAIDALIESYINLKKAQENKSIWQQAGIVGEKSITGKVSGGTEVGNLLAGFGIDFGGIIGEMVKSIASLSSVTKLLDPIATIFDGIMSTLGPVIDEVFAPLANMLTQVGIAIGQILAPALQVLMPIIQTLAKLFVRLYNDVVVPVGNAVIKTFNKIFNAVADVINWILGAVNAALGWLIGNIALIEKKGVNSGLLTPISGEDLAAKKEGEINYTEELKKANEQLKKNRELFTLASKAADAYKAVLTKVKSAAADFYDSLQNVGSDIADSIINGILNGFSSEDFAYEMQEYLTKAVVKAAVFTESFMTQIANIGKEIANGIANGFSEDQLRGLRDRLAELYNNAQVAAEAATSLVQSAFTSAPMIVTVPNVANVGNKGVKNISNEPVIAPDVTINKGLSGIGNYVQALMPRFGQAIQAVAYGTVNIDGREIGRIAFDYSDQFQRAMYGA